MKSLFKNILFVVSLGLLIVLAYAVFWKDDAIVVDEFTESEARVNDQEFLAKLKELQDLELDSPLFDDEEFLSLVDHTVQVVDEDAGRPNPFAPVPGLVTSEAESTTR
jgi:hypothetical protein